METYTVKSGDTLSKIAQYYYGDMYAYDKIAQANNIDNPNLIEPGQVLVIPDVLVVTSQVEPLPQQARLNLGLLAGLGLLLFLLFTNR